MPRLVPLAQLAQLATPDRKIPFPEALDYLGLHARAYGMTRLARELDVSRESLYRSLRKTGKPRFRTLYKAVKLLNVGRLEVDVIEKGNPA